MTVQYNAGHGQLVRFRHTNNSGNEIRGSVMLDEKGRHCVRVFEAEPGAVMSTLRSHYSVAADLDSATRRVLRISNSWIQ